MAEKIIDLTHRLSPDLFFYPGDPKVEFKQVQFTSGIGYNVNQIKLGTHSGTHSDAPYHINDKGEKVDKINLNKCIGEAQIIDMSHKKEGLIEVKDLEPYNKIIKPGSRLLIRTGWDKMFGRKEFFSTRSPSLSIEVGKWLRRKKIWLLGLDTASPNLKNREDNLKLHRIFLEAGIVLVEALTNLEKLEGKVYLIVLPLKLKGMDASPARVVVLERKIEKEEHN